MGARLRAADGGDICDARHVAGRVVRRRSAAWVAGDVVGRLPRLQVQTDRQDLLRGNGVRDGVRHSACAVGDGEVGLAARPGHLRKG